MQLAECKIAERTELSKRKRSRLKFATSQMGMILLRAKCSRFYDASKENVNYSRRITD